MRRPSFFFQELAGSGNGEAFIVKQALDFEHQFYIFAALEAVSGA